MQAIDARQVARHLAALVLVLTVFACKSVSFEEAYNGYSSKGFHARGLVLQDSIVCLTGSKGKVTLFSLNSYSIIDTFTLPASDFRGVQFSSPNHLLVMNSGDNGIVYRYNIKTRVSDTVLYQESAFYDAIRMSDKGIGYIMGDPLNGQFLVYKTTDFGKTWQKLNDLPPPLKDEAGFAASNTGISLVDNAVFIATGAADTARIITNLTNSESWEVINTEMPSGGSFGIYSVKFLTKNEGFIAGGSYVELDRKEQVVYFTKNSGKTWQNRSAGLPGYMSCVTSSSKGDLVVVTGRLGAYFSTNKGKEWQLLTKAPFYSAAIQGKRIVLSGQNGTLAIFREIQ